MGLKKQCEAFSNTRVLSSIRRHTLNSNQCRNSILIIVVCVFRKRVFGLRLSFRIIVFLAELRQSCKSRYVALILIYFRVCDLKSNFMVKVPMALLQSYRLSNHAEVCSKNCLLVHAKPHP